jgi:glucosamine-6-phosphate deaminase
VIWLSNKVNKPILRLEYEDYEDNNLSDLIVECAGGKVENLNLYVYRKVWKKITAWPLGNKPVENSEESIIKTTLQPKKVLVFSPHPDDDVISMGGTIRKLVEQGNHVYVAYMTSGSNGVFDYDAQKYFYFLEDVFNSKMYEEKSNDNFTKFYQSFKEQTNCAEEYFNDPSHMKKNDKFLEFVNQIKRFIRSSEAKISVKDLGVSPNNVYNLNLPFYYSKKRTPGEEDDKIVLSLLRLIEPDFIYAAGK